MTLLIAAASCAWYCCNTKLPYKIRVRVFQNGWYRDRISVGAAAVRCFLEIFHTNSGIIFSESLSVLPFQLFQTHLTQRTIKISPHRWFLDRTPLNRCTKANTKHSKHFTFTIIVPYVRGVGRVSVNPICLSPV